MADIPAAAVSVPYPVATSMTQATREALLNVQKHARADNIEVYVGVTATTRRINVLVSVADDGRGFRIHDVPDERLGIRIALKARLQSVGGSAEVDSVPGRGTVVRLKWSGERASRSLTTVAQKRPFEDNPVIQLMDNRLATVAGVLFVVTNMLLGLLTVPYMPRPELFAPASIVFVVAYLVLIRFGQQGHTRRPIVWFVVFACIAGSTLGVLAVAADPWPLHSGWFVRLIVVIALMLNLFGELKATWVCVLGHAVVIFAISVPFGLSWGRMVFLALLPFGVVMIQRVLFHWADLIWLELELADVAAEEATQVNAVQFSKSVAREVWLAELKKQVGPALEKIADSQTQLTEADRQSFLLMEAGLRDGIKAASFHTSESAEAILQARKRGVVVTLVDNRGDSLPETVRRAAVSALIDQLDQASHGRVVARTAPQGYGAAVTIMRAPSEGNAWLTTISEFGDVKTVESGS